MRDCHVVVVQMQRSQLTDSSLATLCRSLQFNESVSVLDLAHNSMSHLAFTALGEVLVSNTALQVRGMMVMMTMMMMMMMVVVVFTYDGLLEVVVSTRMS
jgi:Ran GTPase-activating protein (RanGAP) involved in mRNA processing and transport